MRRAWVLKVLVSTFKDLYFIVITTILEGIVIINYLYLPNSTPSICIYQCPEILGQTRIEKEGHCWF